MDQSYRPIGDLLDLRTCGRALPAALGDLALHPRKWTVTSLRRRRRGCCTRHFRTPRCKHSSCSATAGSSSTAIALGSDGLLRAQSDGTSFRSMPDLSDRTSRPLRGNPSAACTRRSPSRSTGDRRPASRSSSSRYIASRPSCARRAVRISTRLLYNRDAPFRRTAGRSLPRRQSDVTVRLNEPYHDRRSLRLHDPVHGERRGIPHVLHRSAQRSHQRRPRQQEWSGPAAGPLRLAAESIEGTNDGR